MVIGESGKEKGEKKASSRPTKDNLSMFPSVIKIILTEWKLVSERYETVGDWTLGTNHMAKFICAVKLMVFIRFACDVLDELGD